MKQKEGKKDINSAKTSLTNIQKKLDKNIKGKFRDKVIDKFEEQKHNLSKKDLYKGYVKYFVVKYYLIDPVII